MGSSVLKCDRCGASLYAKVNQVLEGERCGRTIIPEYDGHILRRTCDGILRKPPRRR